MYRLLVIMIANEGMSSQLVEFDTKGAAETAYANVERFDSLNRSSCISVQAVRLYSL